jgi:Domain of unknown function (DUF4349)
MRHWLILSAAIFLPLLGCGGTQSPESNVASPARSAIAGSKKGVMMAEGKVDGVPMAPPAGQPQEKAEFDKAVAPNAGAANDPGPVPGQAHGEKTKRKIVYNGNVELIVTDLDKAEASLKAILKECNALVGSSELTGSAGSPRSGHWRVRVPVDHFEEFIDAIIKVGIPERNTTDSQDVSDEYYDLEDRIKNKKMELETLRGYLQEKKATSQLETILTIEKELSRVRGELDQLEGRLRRMKDLTALATINVTMKEVKDYQPQPAPTFGNSVQGTFADSIDLLVRFGKGVVIVAVAVGPWLALLALIAVPGWRIGRRYWKREAEQ